MHRALAPLLIFAFGCDDGTLSDRIQISLAGGETYVRMDLEPVTLTDVDNNIDVDVLFALDSVVEPAIPASIVFTQYRVDYGLGDDPCDSDQQPPGENCAPYFASDAIDATVTEGDTVSLSLRGAVEAQLDWVAARYTGNEFDVPARLSIAGLYDERIPVLGTFTYTATFADYR